MAITIVRPILVCSWSTLAREDLMSDMHPLYRTLWSTYVYWTGIVQPICQSDRDEVRDQSHPVVVEF